MFVSKRKIINKFIKTEILAFRSLSFNNPSQSSKYKNIKW